MAVFKCQSQFFTFIRYTNMTHPKAKVNFTLQHAMKTQSGTKV